MWCPFFPVAWLPLERCGRRLDVMGGAGAQASALAWRLHDLFALRALFLNIIYDAVLAAYSCICITCCGEVVCAVALMRCDTMPSASVRSVIEASMLCTHAPIAAQHHARHQRSQQLLCSAIARAPREPAVRARPLHVPWPSPHAAATASYRTVVKLCETPLAAHTQRTYSCVHSRPARMCCSTACTMQRSSVAAIVIFLFFCCLLATGADLQHGYKAQLR